MASSPIAPVILPASRPSGRGQQGERVVRRLPLADSLPARSRVRDVVYGLARIDASGRVADRGVTAALSWCGGDRLTLTAESGLVVARRDPGGLVTLQARLYLVIPAALRHRCGLRAGDQVLLAAWPGEDAVTAFPLAVVDQAVRAHGLGPSGTGGTQ